MQAFYTGLERWRNKIIRNVKSQIIDWLVLLNFGPGQQYEISAKPMAEQAMEQQQSARPGGSGGDNGQSQGQPQQLQHGQPRQLEYRPGQGPQRMNLEEQVGRGILDAANVVRAGREFVRRWVSLGARARRLATDASGHEHKGKGEGGGQFTSGDKGGASGGSGNTNKPGEWKHGASHETIASLVADAVKSKSSASGMTVAYAAVSAAAASRIKKKTGLDVRGYSHYLDGSAVLKILEDHGPENATGDEQPMSPADFDLLASVVENPDKITYVGKTKQGLDAIRLTKRFNGTLFVVEEVRSKKRLAVKTIWKIRSNKTKGDSP